MQQQFKYKTKYSYSSWQKKEFPSIQILSIILQNDINSGN